MNLIEPINTPFKKCTRSRAVIPINGARRAASYAGGYSPTNRLQDAPTCRGESGVNVGAETL